MIYRVLLDGNDILNFQEREYVLLSPSLDMELNTAGSFEFTMPPCHPFYDSVRLPASTVEVYEDAVLADINGVKLLITDAACAPTYGGCDIAIYSRYKKAADVNINGITVLCDKRYADSPYNAYFRDIEIRIDREGNVLVKTG